MKIRNSFVSNSSTSSFVLIGVKISEEKIIEKFNCTKEDCYLAIEEADFDWLDNETVEVKENELIVGKEIASGDASDFGGSPITLSEFDKIVSDITEKLGVDKSELKIYSGIKAC